MMKAVLKRVQQHTKNCSISNLPAGQNDCTTCNKWQSMVKLREHYRRKLISYMHANKSAIEQHYAPGGGQPHGAGGPPNQLLPSPSAGEPTPSDLFNQFQLQSGGGGSAAIEKLLKDDEKDVREAAAQVLHKLS